MANRKIVQEQKFLLGWDDVSNVPIFSINHGASWSPVGGSGGGGVTVHENGSLVLASAVPLDFVTDIAGSKEFAEVIIDGAGVDIEIDKQINYGPLLGSVGPVPTGFTFDAETYRACEVIYYLVKETGEIESGNIMMVHDGTNAGVVVTRRGSEVAPLTGGDPGVQFSADINTTPNPDECRLLYTETNGDALYLSVKPRPIRPGQILNIEFVTASASELSDLFHFYSFDIEINSSDGGNSGIYAEVDVVDSLTGTAISGVDYTVFAAATPTWLVGSVDGTTVAVTVEILGTNVDKTIIFDIDVGTLVGAIAGTILQFTLTLTSAGA